jgi:phosphate acyltransferase
MIWIAVDAMGGDQAPGHVVDGALAAVRHFDLGVLLVGSAGALEPEVARYPDLNPDRVRILHAPDVVAMEESPAAALRDGSPSPPSESRPRPWPRGTQKRCSVRATREPR